MIMLKLNKLDNSWVSLSIIYILYSPLLPLQSTFMALSNLASYCYHCIHHTYDNTSSCYALSTCQFLCDLHKKFQLSSRHNWFKSDLHRARGPTLQKIVYEISKSIDFNEIILVSSDFTDFKLIS